MNETTPRPLFESWAARVGVAVLVALSIWVGWHYWESKDIALAVLTAGAELVAFAGLAVAFSHFPKAWGRGLGALLVTALAASWCAMTMFQKIDADTRAEAIRVAQERPAYTFAASAADVSSRLLRERLEHPNPRPACSCPETVRAWEASEAASIDRLRNERDAAVRQMESTMPPVRMDWIAVARGVGVEIAKLLGFLVFCVRSPSGFAWLRKLRIPFLAGATALAATPAFAGEVAQNSSASLLLQPDQIVYLPSNTKKAQAFSMRGRFRPDEIAAKVGVHQSTVYRWFADRDRAAA